MLKKILLAFDGSESSLKAVDYALTMARNNNAEVQIVHVRESVRSYSTRVIYDAIEMENELVSEAEEIITMAIEKFKDSGVVFTISILIGDPAEAICEEAEKIGATEIVMGNRGMNPVSRFFVGSVSLKVLSHANCTTIIVR